MFPPADRKTSAILGYGIVVDALDRRADTTVNAGGHGGFSGGHGGGHGGHGDGGHGGGEYVPVPTWPPKPPHPKLTANGAGGGGGESSVVIPSQDPNRRVLTCTNSGNIGISGEMKTLTAPPDKLEL
ncbi:hypothetical protein PSPO01_14493 [Paraphaeosphaeria sporulosa]